MLKKNILLFIFSFLHLVVKAQYASISSKKIDSLKYVLETAKDDSTRINTLGGLGFNYQVLNIDSALKYTQAGINLAKQKNNYRSEANLLATLSGIMSQQGKFAVALDLLFKSLKIAEDNDLPYDIARANRRLGGVYFDLENYPKAISYGLKALNMDEEKEYKSASTDHISLANAYDKMENLDTALIYANMAIKESEFLNGIVQTAYRIAGDVQIKKGKYQQADSLFRKGLELSIQNNDFLTASEVNSSMATMFLKLNKKDSVLFYALKGFEYGEKVSYKKGIINSARLLAELYESTKPSIALKYYKIIAAENDSLFGVANIQTIQNLISHEEEKRKELADARVSYLNSLKLYGLLAGLFSLLIFTLILYRNIMQKQKANVVLESTLSNLKSAQAQLIQSEKMASLGELTAGIAHEIQNPLNFVNNFSEVSNELMVEMVDEVGKGNYDEVKAIALDVQQNLEKINHHGHRASSIVKGMLEHSRASTGKKEPTDINALADEYLRLAYHGLRAKDKTFNAEMVTNFDPNLPKIEVIPQDIGRVFLNIITNAFFAVNEKSKKGEKGYQPTVSITTQLTANSQLQIAIQDNGSGIPDSIKDKIFQPFFTTKPTGQGTGLGLSLAYDIVKAHGGALEVHSNEEEGTKFIITLPLNN